MLPTRVGLSIHEITTCQKIKNGKHIMLIFNFSIEHDIKIINFYWVGPIKFVLLPPF